MSTEIDSTHPGSLEAQNLVTQSRAESDDTKPYGDFIFSSEDLEEKLQDFSQKILKLGSAHGLYETSLEVKKGLAHMRSYFEADETLLPGYKMVESMASKKRKNAGPGGDSAPSSKNPLSVHLQKLSLSLSKFAIGLTHFDDYYERKTYLAIENFRTEILILSEAVAYFRTDSKGTPELNTFIKARFLSASDYKIKTSAALSRFIDTGIPCISDAQNRSSSMMLNASTVATFFAGVAATALQYSEINLETTIGRAVQTLWFSSLVLSISSAVTSLLILAWRQAILTPRILPLYIRFWIRSGYLVLLSAAIVTFISGLVAYVYALQHTRSMFWVVTACTAFCAFSLGNLSIYFALDYWVFLRSRKSRTPAAQVPQERDSRFDAFRLFWKNRRNLGSTEQGPVANLSGHDTIWTPLCRTRILGLLRNWRYIWRYTRSKLRRLQRRVSRGLCIVPVVEETFIPEKGSSGNQESLLDTRPVPHCSKSSIQTLSPKDEQDHYTSYISYRKILDMQFSPNGKWLAVCDKVCCHIIGTDIQADDDFLYMLIKQVKWSPDGRHLLTRTNESVQIWNPRTTSFDMEKFITPGKRLVDVEWLSNDALSNNAESLFTVHVDSEDPVEIRLLPSGLTIYEMTTIDKPELILFLATRNIKGLPNEKGISCIIVYDMEKASKAQTGPTTLETVGIIKSKVPLMSKAIGLAVGNKKSRFVVTYEGAMPDVWSILINKEDGSVSISRKLELRLIGKKSKATAVWGSASFVGADDDIIACAEDDVIHFWKDGSGEFDFQHFYSLPINRDKHTLGDISNSDSGSSDEVSDALEEESDLDSGDNVKEKTVFAWNFSSGLTTMVSGYMSDLQIWCSKDTESKPGGDNSPISGALNEHIVIEVTEPPIAGSSNRN